MRVLETLSQRPVHIEATCHVLGGLAMIKQGTLAYKAIALPGLVLLQTTEFIIRKVDGNDCFHDPARFPWVRDIESQWQTIRSEFNELLPQTIPAAQQIS